MINTWGALVTRKPLIDARPGVRGSQIAVGPVGWKEHLRRGTPIYLRPVTPQVDDIRETTPGLHDNIQHDYRAITE